MKRLFKRLFKRKEKILPEHYKEVSKIVTRNGLSEKPNRLYIKWKTGYKKFEMYRTKDPLKVLKKRVISNMEYALYNGKDIVKNGRLA